MAKEIYSTILGVVLVITVITTDVGPYALPNAHLHHLDPHNHLSEASTESVSPRMILVRTMTDGTLSIRQA